MLVNSALGLRARREPKVFFDRSIRPQLTIINKVPFKHGSFYLVPQEAIFPKSASGMYPMHVLLEPIMPETTNYELICVDERDCSD